MAKQRGAVGVRGKIGDTTFTDGKNGKRARQSATFTEKQKNDARNRPQVKRTAGLNRLGSPLRHAIRHYNYGHVSAGFWEDLLKAFREEKTNHRVLLLQKTVNMEIDFNRQFIEMCPVPRPILKTTAKRYCFDVDISQPAKVDEYYDCYCLQFILVVWNKKDELVRHMEEQTDWFSPKDSSLKFVTLKFLKTAEDTEWVLVCRLTQGQNSDETGYTTDCRLRIIATGTVSPESLKIIKQREAEIEAQKKIVSKVPAAMEKKKKLVVRGKM